MSRIIMIALAMITGLVVPANAQNSMGFALQGSKAWGAFKCAGLAQALGKHEERQRLSAVGYANGVAFLDAYLHGRIDQQDISNYVPGGVLLAITGEPVDFVVAKIAIQAKENATLLAGHGRESTHLDLLVAFGNQNCRHLD